MKKFFSVPLCLCGFILFFCATTLGGAQAQNFFSIYSALLENGQDMPRSGVYGGNGCRGMNMSPPLEWSAGPQGTGSYAISMFDPDAPNDGFLHWVVFNIPVSVLSLPGDAGAADGSKLPEGANSIANSYGENGYGGPCPPKGDEAHRYEFTVYAMPPGYTFYPLSSVGRSTVRWLREKALASATLTVLYGR